MYKVVVVGTDGSPTADKAVQAAADIARSWGSALHVVTAVACAVDPAMGAGDRRPPGRQRGGRRRWPSEAAQAGGRAGRREVRDGLAGRRRTRRRATRTTSILNTAAEVGADLIVVGSKGMRGARRYLGSVPNSVAHGAHCAVLSSRPTRRSARMPEAGAAGPGRAAVVAEPLRRAHRPHVRRRLGRACSIPRWSAPRWISWPAWPGTAPRSSSPSAPGASRCR